MHFEQFAAIIITHMPSADIVSKVNRIFAQGVTEVIIVDNTPDDYFFSVLSLGLFDHMPRVIRNKKNLGVARALNQGMEMARDLGYKWVVAFDQDTTVAADFFSQMAQVYERISSGTGRLIAVLGPNYIDQVLQSPAYTVDWSVEATEVRDVITSGSLLSVEVFSSLGGFDEKLFIDMVDTEYCFRVRRAGYMVWRTSKPLMEHSLGSLTSQSFLGFRFNVTNHLPQRRYYIFRNTLYMVWNYKSYDPQWALKMMVDYLPKVFIKACVFETKRWQNFLYILRGSRDAFLARYDRNFL